MPTHTNDTSLTNKAGRHGCSAVGCAVPDVDGMRVGNQNGHERMGLTAKHAPSGVRHAFHEATFVPLKCLFKKATTQRARTPLSSSKLLSPNHRVCPPNPRLSRMASRNFFVPSKLFSETPVLSRLRGLNPFEARSQTMPLPVDNVSPFTHTASREQTNLISFKKGDRVHVVVVFGRTGMGISSLVNLILGREDAPFSTDMHPCTLAPAAYRVDINGHAFDIYDIPGFGNEFVPEKTISDLYTERGIDLLIYCLRPKEGIAKKIFNAVRSAVPERVPMVGVITALEKHSHSMEDWWSGPRKNSEMLASRGLKFVDHACVTTLSREDVSYNMDMYERRYQSTQAVRNLIWRNCNGTKRVTYVKSAGYLPDLPYV